MSEQSDIPTGPYCYHIKEIKGEKIETHTCPFWELREDKHEQENGYCHYLKFGDWESEGISLLWDMVKECGINMENEP